MKHLVASLTSQPPKTGAEFRTGIRSVPSVPWAPKSGSAIDTIGDQNGDADYPANEIEATVAQFWTDVFGHQDIGIHEQFADLGGHSLLAMKIVSKVRTFYEIDLSVREFFAAPTIAQLSFEVEMKIRREIETLSDDEAGRFVQTLEGNEISFSRDFHIQ